MKDKNSLCMGCMNMIDPDSVFCPYCGYRIGITTKNRKLIPEGTSLVNGRYLIGKMLWENENSILYLAYDGQKDEKIAVMEFFPAKYCSRDLSFQTDNRLHLITGSLWGQFACTQDAFEKYIGNHAVNVFKDNDTAYFVLKLPQNKPSQDKLLQGGNDQEKNQIDGYKALSDGFSHVNVRMDMAKVLLLTFKSSKKWKMVTGGAAALLLIIIVLSALNLKTGKAQSGISNSTVNSTATQALTSNSAQPATVSEASTLITALTTAPVTSSSSELTDTTVLTSAADAFVYTMVKPTNSGEGFAEGYKPESADGLIKALYEHRGGTFSIDITYDSEDTLTWNMGGIYYGALNWGGNGDMDEIVHKSDIEETKTMNVDDMIVKYEAAGSTGININLYNGVVKAVITIS